MSIANVQFTCPRYPLFALSNENELIYSQKRSLFSLGVAADKPVSDTLREKEIPLRSTLHVLTDSKISGCTMPTKEESTGNAADIIDLTKKSASDIASSSSDKDATVPTTSGKSKHAPIPIYRPPSLRGGEENGASSPKLNVHAKEFVMSSGSDKNYDVTRSGSTKTDRSFQSYITKMKESAKSNKTFPLNLSKSSGNVTLNAFKPDSSQIGKSSSSFKDTTNLSSLISTSSYDLQRAKSIGDVLTNNRVNGIGIPRVQFNTSTMDKNNNRNTGKSSPIKEKKLSPLLGQQIPGNLKRSKSMGAADAIKFLEMEASFSQLSPTFNDYHLFPERVQALIKQAIHSSHRMADKNKIVLARTVIEYVVKDKKYANSVAKLSLIVMEKDKSGAYLDSLLNTCQMFYQKKETCLLNDEGRFTSFLSFLTEMFIELKQSKLQMKLSSDPITPPKITFLMLISRCCLDVLVRNETHSTSEVGGIIKELRMNEVVSAKSEGRKRTPSFSNVPNSPRKLIEGGAKKIMKIECLFLTLTSVGRDVELELPAMFQKIFHTIRIVFLRSSNGPKIQKTLLQLIELRAANWQLPVSALNYYYPQSSD